MEAYCYAYSRGTIFQFRSIKRDDRLPMGKDDEKPHSFNRKCVRKAEHEAAYIHLSLYIFVIGLLSALDTATAPR